MVQCLRSNLVRYVCVHSILVPLAYEHSVLHPTGSQGRVSIGFMIVTYIYVMEIEILVWSDIVAVSVLRRG